MKKKQLGTGNGFNVVPGNRLSQAAEMFFPPCDKKGDSIKPCRPDGISSTDKLVSGESLLPTARASALGPCR